MTLAGDQFTQNDAVERQGDNREGVNPGDFWKPGSKIEATRVERINDGMQLVATSDQTGFSFNSARYMPAFDQGASNYYAPGAISSDATGYGAVLNGFKTLIASADSTPAGRVPIPHLTGGYEPLAAKFRFNPEANFKYEAFRS